MKFSLKLILGLFTGILIAGLVLLPGCAPSTTANQINISLSEAIALSKSNNIQNVVIDPNNGTMTLTATVNSSPLQITDIEFKPLCLGIPEGLSLP